MQTEIPDLSVSVDAGLRILSIRALASLRHAAQKQQFFLAEMDCEGCLDAASLLGQITRALGLPAWFGHNWDALYDCLTDSTVLPIAPGYVLLLRHLDVFRQTDADAWRQFKQVCNDAAQENATQKPACALWTFVLEAD